MNISINSYKNIQQEHFRQVKYNKELPLCLYIKKAREYFNLPRKGKRHLKVKERFIQFLIDQSIKYEVVWGLQEKIAEYLKCDERHLRKVIRDLRNHEWITVLDEGACNIYILNPIFQDRSFCIEMGYIWDHLLVDKDIYLTMYASKYYREHKDKPDIKSYQFQETVCDDERFRPAETNQKELSEIFGSSKMPSIYKKEYTRTKDISINIKISQPKKEIVVKDLYSEVIIPYVKELRSVRPTIWGQVKLSAYPKEIVLYADTVTLNCKKNLASPLDRWKYMFSVLSTYCRENKIETFWPMALEIAKEMGMPNDGPFFDDSFIPIPDISVSHKNISRRYKKPHQESPRDIAKILENEEILKREGKVGCLRQQQRSMQDMEQMKSGEPIKFTRWHGTAQAFRKQLGLNEDGTFQPGHSSITALDTLVQIVNLDTTEA